MECDPSIKAIILKIDQDKHDFIVEDLDDQTLVVKESQLQKLKARLEEVRWDSQSWNRSGLANIYFQELANTQQQPDESGSD